MNVDRAVDEVRALAAELGLRAEPVVLADRSNLVLRLDDVVARVAMATSMVRVGMAWLRREVELSEYLASRNANVTRPSARVAPGPHDRHGFVISFWELEIILADRADPIASGQELANAHRCLVDYPVDKLQRWGGFEEASEIFVRTRTSPFFTQDDRRVLERAWDTAAQIVETAHERSASMQAVHGDAHLNNVLATARGRGVDGLGGRVLGTRRMGPRLFALESRAPRRGPRDHRCNDGRVRWALERGARA